MPYGVSRSSLPEVKRSYSSSYTLPLRFDLALSLSLSPSAPRASGPKTNSRVSATIQALSVSDASEWHFVSRRFPPRHTFSDEAMHPSQQSHPVPHGYYTQGSNTSEANPYNDIPTSPHESGSRSSSLSNAIGYQSASSQYASLDMQRQQQYGQQNMYHQDFSQNYPSHTHNQLQHHPPFPSVQRSSSDGVTYTLGQHNASGQGNLRRTSLPLQPGPIRERTVSLSHYRVNEPAGSPLSPYPSPPYPRDPRNPGAHQTHPPTAYRPILSQSVLQQSPISHVSHSPSSHLDTGVPYQARRSSVSSLSSTHLRREMPVSSTQLPFEQAGTSSPSPSGSQPRPHVCESCGLAFVRGHDLKRHKDTHSNAKPHVCECGKSFSRKDALKRHVFLKSCRGDRTGSGYATSED